MLGVDNYGSDSDSSRPSSPKPSHSQPKVVAKSAKTQRAPKKITIALPSISSKSEEDDTKDEREPLAKKRKTGAGVSSLLSMLPTPKESNPIAPQPQRVLGGGSGPGLKFHSHSRAQAPTVETHEREDEADNISESNSLTLQDDEPPSTALFRPTSLAKGRKNISVEESHISLSSKPHKHPTSTPAIDFFSLGSTRTISNNSVTAASSSSSLFPALSSAPSLPTFEVPEPTQTDPYPGYYQLSSGAWAAYDAEYYGKFMKKWEKEYNAHVRALEKGTVKGFEGLQDADVDEIDAMKVMEKAKKEIQEREEKKAITMGAGGAPAAPRMNINASKTNGVARSRHQLSTLLKEAYENREALEERIAQGKRNRKEAGNKYGF